MSTHCTPVLYYLTSSTLVSQESTCVFPPWLLEGQEWTSLDKKLELAMSEVQYLQSSNWNSERNISGLKVKTVTNKERAGG